MRVRTRHVTRSTIFVSLAFAAIAACSGGDAPGVGDTTDAGNGTGDGGGSSSGSDGAGGACTKTVCGADCVDTATDPKHCGGCAAANDCTTRPNVANAGLVGCQAGQCVYPAAACAPGFAHCSSDPSSGCESDLGKPATCGTCTNACPTDKPLCSSGTCQPDCGALTNCDGACVDVATNASYCGNCMTKCSGAKSACIAGQCACPTGTTYCAATDSCRDLTTSATDCGACGRSCAGSTCSAGLCLPEKITVAACPWAIAVSGGNVYWTETTAGGCRGAVRACSTSAPCTALPAPLFLSATSGEIVAPKGLALPAGANAIFFTNNQNPGLLEKMDLDGANRTEWSGTTGNGAGLAASAGTLFWGSGSGVYRTDAATAGNTSMMTGNVSGAVENGPHSIAVDANNVYAALNGGTVTSCPLAADCTTAGSTLIANEPASAGKAGVAGIASDGTNVFYTAGKKYTDADNGAERLVRCPVAGCPSGTPVVLWETTTMVNAGASSHFGIALDSKHVYWGTMAGTIYYAEKTCVAPCAPSVLVTGARPFGMAIDGAYLYWADDRNAVYRVARP